MSASAVSALEAELSAHVGSATSGVGSPCTGMVILLALWSAIVVGW